MENDTFKKRVVGMGQEDQKHYQMEEFGHIPNFNMGRLYASRGMLNHAVKEIEVALAISPGEPHCMAVLQHLKKILN